MSVEDTEKEQSSDGRKKGGRSSGRDLEATGPNPP